MADDDLILDFDRFEYERVETLGGDVYYAKVGCHHRNREDVRSAVTREIVAVLCLDCDTQLSVGHP